MYNSRQPSMSFLATLSNIGCALRTRLKQGYTKSDLQADCMAGIIVGMVALPLGMALAIASGVPPQHGLYTVIIAGSIVALLGGSLLQVTGPTAAFVVVLAPIAHTYGIGGLLVSGLMAGIILVGIGFMRMGSLIQFIPYTVTTGFTAGIATVIATLQIKDLLGLQVATLPEHFIDKLIALANALHTASYIECSIGIATLLILIVWPRWNKHIPAPLIALTLASITTALIKYALPTVSIATIGTKFTYIIDGIAGSGVPQKAPHFALPWRLAGPDGTPFVFSFAMLKTLLPYAGAIAMLGAIESLLSAVIADGMARTKHNPDTELIALGIGNIVCPFFGGIAATGAIARTATNIRAGARSPLASIIHALCTLLVLLFFAPHVAYLPMASLAALLMLVAYNMSEIHRVLTIMKLAPIHDRLVFITCFMCTVFFDMVVGVSVGIILASILFMHTIAQATSSRIFVKESHPLLKEPLPHNVLLYEIAGPLFFGAAERAIEAVNTISEEVETVIFLMDSVPVMDITGLTLFTSTIQQLNSQKQRIILVGLRKQPEELLKKAGLLDHGSYLSCYANLHDALQALKNAHS